MVILGDDSTETESEASTTTATDTDEEQTEEPSSDHDPTLRARIVSAAEQAATLMEPFATLFTAIVQAATVWTLVRKA
jgi:hypothetical protein